ncbi:MAG: hypothetical protein Q4G69_14640 [Planctomycetia bacterium]|nr:hypothetical protein [Planctomycetia bacterium]
MVILWIGAKIAIYFFMLVVGKQFVKQINIVITKEYHETNNLKHPGRAVLFQAIALCIMFSGIVGIIYETISFFRYCFT